MNEIGAILVVSHNPGHADVRKQKLEAAGYEVIPAMNIRAVREACKKRTLQLVVIGYSLPAREVRRVKLEVLQGCGVEVPILELRTHDAARGADASVAIQHPEEHGVAERVRQILETANDDRVSHPPRRVAS